MRTHKMLLGLQPNLVHHDGPLNMTAKHMILQGSS